MKKNFLALGFLVALVAAAPSASADNQDNGYEACYLGTSECNITVEDVFPYGTTADGYYCYNSGCSVVYSYNDGTSIGLYNGRKSLGSTLWYMKRNAKEGGLIRGTHKYWFVAKFMENLRGQN